MSEKAMLVHVPTGSRGITPVRHTGVSNKTKFLVLVTALAGLLSSCDSYDSNYMPYGLTGLDVWVYNDETDKEYYGGRVEASYFSKDKALSDCSHRAYSVAQQYHLDDWSYVCCTVTSSSSCVTKIR